MNKPESKRLPAFRNPIILLVLVNLAVLAARLWPWQDVLTLPGNGTTGIDPAVSLIGYLGVAFWIGSARTSLARGILYFAGWLGVLGGAVLAAQVYLATQPLPQDGRQDYSLQFGLIGAAVVIWSVPAWKAARTGYAAGFGAMCALWSAMVSCAMASLALLGASFYSLSPGQTADPWKQYQGLAIGSEQTQALVHTLVNVTGYLLIGPVVALIAGAVIAAMFKQAKS